jgi:pyruvate,orthophosphate dikinase
VGGKGAGLAEMTQIGVPVPAGFTITTDACRAYMAEGKRLPAGLEEEVAEHVERLEKRTGKRLGDPDDPLLLSVRSGAAVSMPGMMDSILNLGLSDVATEGLAKTTGNERFAHDSYRRLIQMYGEVVDGIDAHRFEQRLTDLKQAKACSRTTSSTPTTSAGSSVCSSRSTRTRPAIPSAGRRDQLTRAVRGVFESWDNPRAQVYRRAHDIPEDLGTAVNVMQMVFGNKGETSATGVSFTRDPATGEPGLYGEFLPNAQGEDVVAGIRTPLRLEQIGDASRRVRLIGR